MIWLCYMCGSECSHPNFFILKIVTYTRQQSQRCINWNFTKLLGSRQTNLSSSYAPTNNNLLVYNLIELIIYFLFAIPSPTICKGKKSMLSCLTHPNMKILNSVLFGLCINKLVYRDSVLFGIEAKLLYN